MEEKRHLGCYGIIVKENCVLLVKKARGAYIGKYDLPGGSIEHGELPIDTLKREILEETGTIVKESKLFDVDSVIVNWNYDGIDVNMHHIGVIYIVSIEDSVIKSDSDGLDSLGALWVNLKDVSKDNVSPLAYRSLKKLGYIY